MLIGGIVAVVVVALVAVAAVLLRRSQDDAHSVEHYHRQLHTLEEIRSHPSVGPSVAPMGGDETVPPTRRHRRPRRAPTAGPETAAGNGTSREAYPASAFRVSGTRTVRLTDLETPVVPPAPPPAVPNPAEPVKFDDTGAPLAAGEGLAEGTRPSFLRGDGDKAMHSIDHRPRRLGAPLAAIGVVTVLVIVLIVTGLHSNTKPSGHGSSSTATTTPVHANGGATGTGHARHLRPATTSTTAPPAPPAVSAPTVASARAATYDVAAGSYSLLLSASSGECWVEAEDPATRTVLFSGTLFAGQSHVVSASGPVVVIAGAPAAFAATVNGVPVVVALGLRSPLHAHLRDAGGGRRRDHHADHLGFRPHPDTFARSREGRPGLSCRVWPYPIGAEPPTCSRRERPAAPPRDLVVGERGSGPAPAEP